MKLQAKQRLTATEDEIETPDVGDMKPPKESFHKTFEVYISYNDPRGGGDIASARIKIPNCKDQAMAKTVFRKTTGRRYPGFKITRVTEVGAPAMNA